MPYRRKIWLLWCLLLATPAGAQHASPTLTFKLADADGLPLAGAEVSLSSDRIQKQGRTDAEGQVRLTVSNGTYQLKIVFNGATDVAEDIAADAPRQLQYTLPVHRFRVLVSATNGDLLQGATARLRDGRQDVELPVLNGRIEGVAHAGEVPLWLTWNAQTVKVTTLNLPERRNEIVELQVVPLSVEVVQKDTRTGFGPALVAVATEGNTFPAGTWTDRRGAVELAVFKGENRVQATWFGESAEVNATAPGRVQIPMALPLRTIPAPLENLPDMFQAQIRQPRFQVWAQGTSRTGIVLPLPEGRYDVMIFDETKKPTHQGVANIKPDQPKADIQWTDASSADAQLAERRLVWPQGLWAPPPTVGVREADGWRRIEVLDRSLGFLPPGMQVRVPDHALGRIYQISADDMDVSVELGVVEIQLPKPGPVKWIAADHPADTFATDCAEIKCRVALPPGKYLTYVPDAQLLKNPVQVDHGQTAYVYAKALEAR